MHLLRTYTQLVAATWRVQNITICSPPDSPCTCGIVPDSSKHICVENSNISMGYDAIALKSGWDEYGIAYGKPTTKIHIREVHLASSSGSGIAFGSEMSGGISNILVEHIHILDSLSGIQLKAGRGRGGYIKNIQISDVFMENLKKGIQATGHYDLNPDKNFDPDALPVVSEISFKDVVGVNVTTVGNFSGIDESPFTSICLSNVSFSFTSDDPSLWWFAPMSLVHLLMYHLNLVLNSKARFPIHPPIVSSCTHIRLVKLQSCNRAWSNHKLFIH